MFFFIYIIGHLEFFSGNFSLERCLTGCELVYFYFK